MLTFGMKIFNFLILLSSLFLACTVKSEYTLEDVKAMTNGLGIFAITVTNNQAKPVIVSTRMKILDLPETLKEIIESGTFGYVQPYASLVLQMQKPYLGYNDIKHFQCSQKPILNAATTVELTITLNGQVKVIKSPAVYEADTAFLSVSDVNIVLN